MMRSDRAMGAGGDGAAIAKRLGRAMKNGWRGALLLAEFKAAAAEIEDVEVGLGGRAGELGIEGVNDEPALLLAATSPAALSSRR